MLSVVKRSPVPSLSLSAGRRPCDYDCGSLLINKWLQCKHRLPVQCSATRLLSKRWVFFLELWISRLRPCFPRVHLVRFSFAIVVWFGGCRIWANAALLRPGPVNGSRTIYISSSKQFLCPTYKTEQFHLASLSPKSRSRLWLLRSMESVTDARKFADIQERSCMRASSSTQGGVGKICNFASLPIIQGRLLYFANCTMAMAYSST